MCAIWSLWDPDPAAGPTWTGGQPAGSSGHVRLLPDMGAHPGCCPCIMSLHSLHLTSNTACRQPDRLEVVVMAHRAELFREPAFDGSAACRQCYPLQMGNMFKPA